MALVVFIVLLFISLGYNARTNKIQKQTISRNNALRTAAGVFRPTNFSEETRLRNVYLDNWHNSKSAYMDHPDIIPYFQTSEGGRRLLTYAQILANCDLWQNGYQPINNWGPILPSPVTRECIPATPPMQKAAFIEQIVVYMKKYRAGNV